MNESKKPENECAAPKTSKLVKGNKKDIAPSPCRPLYGM
jgi:hypothetical protein